MPTLETPVQQTLTAEPSAVSDPNQGALEQVGRVADTVADVGMARIHAANADRLNTVQLDATRRLNDLSLKYQNDPDPVTAPSRFADDAAKIHDEAAGQLPDAESRSSFQTNFGHLSEARRIDIASDTLKTQTEDAAANVVSSMTDYSQAAAAARNPNELHAIMTQASDALSNAVKTRIMRPAQAGKLSKDFHQNFALLSARRAIDTDPAAGVAAIKAGQFPNLDPLAAQREIERGEAEVLARQREHHANLRDAREDARFALEDLDTISKSGLPIDKQSGDRVAALVAASGDRVLADRYSRTVRVSNFMTGLRGARPDEVQGALTNLEDQASRDGANVTLAAGVMAARQFAQAQATGLKEDPLNYAMSQGRAQISPLKLDGTAQPQEYQQRVQQATRVAGWYGTKPAYLTKSETETLTAAMAPTQPVAARLKIAQSLVSGFGPRALDIFGTIAPNDPVVANAGALMVKGNATAARDALHGQALLHSATDGKQSDLRPTPAGRNQLPLVQDLSVATGAAGDAGRGQILATADAIFAVRAAAKGLTGAAVGNRDRAAVDEYTRALNEAAGGRYDDYGNQWGGVARYNGVPVLAPKDIPADKFEDAVHGLSDRALTTHSVGGAAPMVGGKPLAAKDLRGLYTISVGDGLYALSTTDPRQSVTPIHDAKGKLYKFSLLNAFDHAAQK